MDIEEWNKYPVNVQMIDNEKEIFIYILPEIKLGNESELKAISTFMLREYSSFKDVVVTGGPYFFSS